jgi:hypothetical protein
MSWWEQAACKNVEDKSIFFPEQAGSNVEARAAKKVCKMCPVKEDCLAYAIQHSSMQGIWGETSEKERRQIARQTGRQRRCVECRSWFTAFPLPGGGKVWTCSESCRLLHRNRSQNEARDRRKLYA